jgi:thiol-disulfide isomerase/thioredoxin
MFKRLCLSAFAFATLALFHKSVYAQTLTIGDHAPAIAVSKFIKGEPVTAFEKGKIYVIDFWLTDSPNCQIRFPRLNRLQHTHKDVTFIGVSVREFHPERVEPFVAKMGAKMDFRVAMDLVPTGKDWTDGTMDNTWLAAALRGIATVFIVDKDGNVAWIGDPLAMEDPLDKIAAGTWDLKAATAVQAKTREVIKDLNTRLQQPGDPKNYDYSAALAILDPPLAANREVEELFYAFKLLALSKLGRDAERADYLDKLIDGILRYDPAWLNILAYQIVDPLNSDKPSPAMVEVAIKAAKRADELAEGADPGVADTLACAYFAAGKKDLAISTEERALSYVTKETSILARLGIPRHLEAFRK